MSRPGQQPVSYRTVPGRHRTQKWQAATKQNYDGDDWGDYDPYDDYGEEHGEEQPPPLPQQLPAQQQYGPRPTRRTNSFDQGDEGRNFTTAAPSAGPFPTYDHRAAPPTAPAHPHPSDDDPRNKSRMRDFTDPEHVPAPLMTRTSPAPAGWFPPRKSSLTGGSPAEAHMAIAAEAVATTSAAAPTMESAPSPTNAERPLPFIRPSDIYKRIPEERERERRSEESSRPSLDSVQREVEPSGQPGLTAGPRTNLAPVAESRESRLFMDDQGSGSSVRDKPNQASPLAGSQGAGGLQHQPSQGFRSAVQQAWDRADEGSLLTRGDSQSNSDSVSRSNTTSTSAISPITSRVPIPTVGQQVAPIVEEDRAGTHPALRQTQPEQSAPADFEPGYRRSLQPSRTEQSPARTPALADANPHHMGSSMIAETMDAAEPPDVPDQASEIPEATLQTTETPAVTSSHATTSPYPIVGRGRSGTNYSIREADLANTVNASPPDKDGLAETVAEAKAEQDLFLSTHTAASVNPPGANPGLDTHRTGTPTTAGPSSPSKGRVREIADQYQDIHNASRRNSEASIGSNKSRRDGDVVEPTTLASNARPVMDREPSFQPHLPGGWISSAPTPTFERPDEEAVEDEDYLAPPTPRAEGSIDLTPTTERRPLQEVTPSTLASPAPEASFDALKATGEQLGAALLAHMGLGHQTQDFASSQPAEPIQQPDKHPSTRSGQISSQPPLFRQETGDSDAPTSVTSSVPPTPLPKDTPKAGVVDPTSPDRLTDNYFASTVAPLRISSRQSSAEPLDRVADPARPLAVNTLSTIPVSDDTESDRLRKEIVRSLENTESPSIGDAQRTRDALNAPENARSIERDLSAHPTVEGSRPGLLDQRFSWETSRPVASTSNNPVPSPIPAVPKTPEPESPEIKPERAYERPRSSVLHVMNAGSDAESPGESIPEIRIPAATKPVEHPLSPAVSNVVVAPVAADSLQPSATHVVDEALTPTSGDLAPASLSDRAASFDSGPRLPSYYLGNDQLDLTLDHPQQDLSASPSMTQPVMEEPAKAKPGPIPPFRNILAIKSNEERIRSFDQTRQTFADMNTGLSDWLATMVESHPEHADVVSGKPFSLQTSGTLKRGHKASPSMLKFTKQFVSDNQRSASGSSAPDDGTAAAQRRSSMPGNERLDMDKVSQRGKDLMKSAGMLGGKTKGLFAKGKSKFGTRRDGDKALFPSSTASAAVFSSPLPPPDLPTSANHSSLRGGAATPPPPSDTSSPNSQPEDTYLSLHPTLSHGHASHSRTSSVSHDTSSSRPFTNLSSLFRTVSRTKSKSKSPNPSRSHLNPNSRPTSLVLPKPDPYFLRQGISISGTVDESDFRRPGSSSTGGGGDGTQASTALGSVNKARREAWEEAEGEASNDMPSRSASRGRSDGRITAVPPAAGRGALRIPGISGLGNVSNVNDDHENLDSFENRKRHLERLGVLPSPAETTFESGLLGSSPTSLRKSRDGGDSGDVVIPPSPIAGKGNRRRTGSDLATLPSQIRRKSVASSSIREEQDHSHVKGKDETIEVGKKGEHDSELVEEEEEEAEIEEVVFHASPVTVKPMQPILVTNVGKREEQDEEDLYGVTPITPKVPTMPDGSTDATESAPVTTQRKGESEAADDKAEGLGNVEPTVQQSVPSTIAPSPDADAGVRAGTGEWTETRSEISAEAVALPVEPARRDSAVSRRSSVSSLGGPDLAIATSAFPPGSHDDVEEAIVMSAQAVPAGPAGPSIPTTPSTSGHALQETTRQPGPIRMTSSEALEYRERFANRSYQQDAEADRPLSYVPLPRDSGGAPAQESLLPREQYAVEVSKNTRPSSGTPKFKPHPAVRGMAVQPTEYERLRTSVPQPVEPDTVHRPRQGDGAKSKKPGTFPGLLPRKNRQSEPDAPPAPKAGASGEPGPSGFEPLARLPDLDKQGRRRSLVMDSIFRRPSVAERGKTSHAIPIADPPAAANPPPQSEAMKENGAADQSRSRPSTLKKPQRSASTASTKETEQKKKRFSMGGIFGRSSTTGHATAKPTRLSKMPPPIKEDTPQISTPAVGERDSILRGNIRGYEAYEALRQKQQEVPAFQENASRISSQQPTRPPSSHREPRLPNLGTMPEDGAMPSGAAWYSPGNLSRREPLSVSTDPPSSQFRRASVPGPRREHSYADIPEAFRPTAASFVGPVQPIGPPPELQSARQIDDPNPRTAPPRYYGGPSPPPIGDLRRPRQTSYGSDVSQPSRQMTGGTDIREASISPVYSRSAYDGHPLPRDTRSMGREFIPTPPGDYVEPPPPWGLDRPRESGEPLRHPRNPSSSPAQWYPRSIDRSISPEEQFGPRGPYRPPTYGPPFQPSSPHGAFPPHGSPGSSGYPPHQPMPSPPPPPPLPLMYGFHPDSAAYTPSPYNHTSPFSDSPQFPAPLAPRSRNSMPRPPSFPQSRQPPRPYGEEARGPSDPAPHRISRKPFFPGPPPPQSSAGQRGYPSQQQGYPAQQQQQPAASYHYQRQEYERQQQQQQQQQYQQRGQDRDQHPDPQRQEPPQQQRRRSSYTGRRDDPTVGEEDLQMRGASYPGQEWTPSGLSGDWD